MRRLGLIAAMCGLICIAVADDKPRAMTREQVLDYLKLIDKSEPVVTDDRLDILEQNFVTADGKPKTLSQKQIKDGMDDGSLVLLRRLTLRKFIRALESSR